MPELDGSADGCSRGDAQAGDKSPLYERGLAFRFKRHRDNPQLKAFVNGATAAATGAITGAVVVLGQRAIFDLLTAAIGLLSLGLL